MCQQVWLAVGGSVSGPKWCLAILILGNVLLTYTKICSHEKILPSGEKLTLMKIYCKSTSADRSTEITPFMSSLSNNRFVWHQFHVLCASQKHEQVYHSYALAHHDFVTKPAFSTIRRPVEVLPTFTIWWHVLVLWSTCVSDAWKVGREVIHGELWHVFMSKAVTRSVPCVSHPSGIQQ